MNMDILGNSEVKWTGMGEFNSDDHCIYYCRQESLTRNRSHHGQQKSPKCSAAAAAKSLQSCLTLCDPIDGSPPGSPVPGILQARTLEWVARSRLQFPPPVQFSSAHLSCSVVSDSLDQYFLSQKGTLLMSELLSYFLGTRHFKAFLIPWHGDFSMFSRTHTLLSCKKQNAIILKQMT